MRLHGKIRSVSSLSAFEQDRMLALMMAHYDNIYPDKFQTDLAEKQGVVMLSDASGEIQGFTTFALVHLNFQGRRIATLYSGDTIIARHCWGQLELFRVYGELFTTLLRQYPSPTYWFLLTKGIKTYGLLPLFFQQFYPNCATPTPDYEQQLLDFLATRKFNGCYVKSQGIVRLTPQADRLKPALADVPNHKRCKPHIQFFLERNPGYVNGDELACLAQISASNFTHMAQRFMKCS